MKPTAAILSVGNEVLRGSVVNTNAAFLGRELSGLGFEVISHGVCADSLEAIRFRLGEVLRHADVIFMMGGLGPTPDDVTREGVAAYFNVPLVFSAAKTTAAIDKITIRAIIFFIFTLLKNYHIPFISRKV